jgi:hypothetical protein
MDQGLVRNALVHRLSCVKFLLKSGLHLRDAVNANVLLLGAIGVVGVVTGTGKTSLRSVLTESELRGRMMESGSRKTLRPRRINSTCAKGKYIYVYIYT